MPNPEDSRHNPSHQDSDQEETVDLRDMGRRVGKGAGQIVGFALVGLVIAAVVALVASLLLPVTTSTRVVLSFPGIVKGQYPDGSNFEPDDVGAPDVIASALQRERLDTSSDFQATIRAALSISGVMPADVAKERDRMRSLGQTPLPFIPDEYSVALTLRRSFSLSAQQRALLLDAIITAYKEKFERTYVDVPLGFGSAFNTLRDADYFEYEMVLDREVESIASFLRQRIADARNFRSATTNLSFGDLLNQTDIFSQISLNGTLGLIRQGGLSKDRRLAMIKMDYYLETLKDKEWKAVEEEKTVDELLAKAQEHAQGYVLGIKSQEAQPRSEAPLLDQGLIDSLLANDSYNFLVRRALDAGMQVKQIQANEAQLLERKKNMQAFIDGAQTDQSVLVGKVMESMTGLKADYDALIDKIRLTQADYARQEFANAISVSDVIRTNGLAKPVAEASVIGAFLGAALGIGLSLLEVYVGGRRNS